MPCSRPLPCLGIWCVIWAWNCGCWCGATLRHSDLVLWTCWIQARIRAQCLFGGASLVWACKSSGGFVWTSCRWSLLEPLSPTIHCCCSAGFVDVVAARVLCHGTAVVLTWRFYPSIGWCPFCAAMMAVFGFGLKRCIILCGLVLCSLTPVITLCGRAIWRWLFAITYTNLLYIISVIGLYGCYEKCTCDSCLRIYYCCLICIN